MKRWCESLRWIAITQGRGGPASSPSILLGQLLLRVTVRFCVNSVPSRSSSSMSRLSVRGVELVVAVLARVLHRDDERVADEGRAGHLAARRPVGEREDLTRVGTRGRHEEQPVVAEHTNEVC